MEKKFDICILGGAGHVGLPLALVFASKACKTLVYDINTRALDMVAVGKMPFMEVGGDALLKEVLLGGNLILSNEKKLIRESKTVIITIGTPVDEFLNPIFRVMTDLMNPLLEFLHDQLIILRSTVCPGVTDWLSNYL